mgnify:CR=1 FL=1
MDAGLFISTWLYFGVASLVVLVTIFLYIYMLRLPFTIYYLRRFEHQKVRVPIELVVAASI